MIHSELEKRTAKLNILVHLPNQVAFGIPRVNLRNGSALVVNKCIL